jgi:hypothetical protein
VQGRRGGGRCCRKLGAPWRCHPNHLRPSANPHVPRSAGGGIQGDAPRTGGMKQATGRAPKTPRAAPRPTATKGAHRCRTFARMHPGGGPAAPQQDAVQHRIKDGGATLLWEGKEHAFDRVFGPGSTTADVAEAAVFPMLLALVNDYFSGTVMLFG